MRRLGRPFVHHFLTHWALVFLLITFIIKSLLFCKRSPSGVLHPVLSSVLPLLLHPPKTSLKFFFFLQDFQNTQRKRRRKSRRRWWRVWGVRRCYCSDSSYSPTVLWAAVAQNLAGLTSDLWTSSSTLADETFFSFSGTTVSTIQRWSNTVSLQEPAVVAVSSLWNPNPQVLGILHKVEIILLACLGFLISFYVVYVESISCQSTVCCLGC